MNAIAKTSTGAALPIDALGGGAGGPLPVPSPWTNNGNYVSYSYGGAVIGAPVGGDQGVGTLNVQSGLYINGAPLSALFQPKISMVMEQVAVLSQNTLANLAHQPDQQLFELFVDGRAFFPVGSTPDFSLSGQTITWLSTVYGIDPGATVIAVYTRA